MSFNLSHLQLLNPLLKAMHQLGGSGTVDEIENEVARILGLTDEQLNHIHRGSTTEFSYRLAWARNYLKHYGTLANSSRGVWALTPKGTQTQSLDPIAVRIAVSELLRKARELSNDEEIEDETEHPSEPTWQEQMISVLQAMPPAKFEKLSQRLLRELGFANVEVTGRSGDGGIDGKGVFTFGGVLGFRVVFQCKRFSGVVGPAYVRDFRGAWIGRADKGLFITTGAFSADAKKEALREGAPPVDLLDGDQLVEKLKDLGLGVEVSQVEQVRVLKEWFDQEF